MINIQYELERKRLDYIETLRNEYRMWITHLFGATDPRDKSIQKLTFADIESYLQFVVDERIAERKRKDKEEEARQKALLDRLKMLQ